MAGEMIKRQIFSFLNMAYFKEKITIVALEVEDPIWYKHQILGEYWLQIRQKENWQKINIINLQIDWLKVFEIQRPCPL